MLAVALGLALALAATCPQALARVRPSLRAHRHPLQLVPTVGTEVGIITGLVAAVYSPFHANGTLNKDPRQIEAQAAYLNETGVGVAYVCGTTGESVDLTLSERMALAELWKPATEKHGLKLMVHVGTDSVVDGRELARYRACAFGHEHALVHLYRVCTFGHGHALVHL